MTQKEQIIDIISKPQNEEVAYEIILPSVNTMAKIIASLANTKGGHLILGFSEEHGIKGLNQEFYTSNTLKKSTAMLSPAPQISYEEISIEHKVLFVISVEISSENILLKDKKYIRIGSKVKEDKSNQKKISTKEYEKTYAIIIALEDYAQRPSDQIPSVKYAKRDAELFRNILINQMDVAEDDITLFVNEAAMKSSLEYDLQGLFHILTEKDRLIFYYVGHGFHDGVSNYLSTYDMHPFNVTTTAISLRKLLLDPFSESKCKSALIFIDACATHIQKENGRNVLSNIDYSDFHLEKNENLYSAAFFSCQAGQSSYSCDKLSHGIWTYHLVEAINGHVPSIITDKKFLTDRSLVDYLATEVHKYTKEHLGYEQSPKAVLDADSEFVLTEIKNS